MWLAHGRYVSCLWASSPWMPKFRQFLADFGLEKEYLAIFFEKKVARIYIRPIGPTWRGLKSKNKTFLFLVSDQCAPYRCPALFSLC